MIQTTTIFIAGISGVFIGMGLLYLAIQLTSRLTAPLEKNRKKESSQ